MRTVMKRKPCTKVPLPTEPKRKSRRTTVSTVPSTKSKNSQTNVPVSLEGESESQQEIIELKSKSPFYKKIVDQLQVEEAKKTCAKEINSSANEVQTKEKPDSSAVDQSVVIPAQCEEQSMVRLVEYQSEVKTANQSVMKTVASMDSSGVKTVDSVDKPVVKTVDTMDQSGISLNSSYITLSTADSASLSQASSATDTCSEDRYTSSQSSKNEFTLSKTSDGSEQLDYNDTLTSEETTPNTSLLSPRNRTLKSGRPNESGSSKSVLNSPAVEVVIERDIIEFVDYDNLDSNQVNKEAIPYEEIRPDLVDKKVSPSVNAAVDDSQAEKNTLGEGKTGTATGERTDDLSANKDENNNVSSVNLNSDQAVMAITYNQTDQQPGETNSIGSRDNNNNINGFFAFADPNFEAGVVNHADVVMESDSESLQSQDVASHSDGIIREHQGLKEATTGTQTAYSTVMPSGLEPRQLIQVRHDSSCPLSPITEENAVERVAKELVNTYGGQNSHRIPDFLQDHTRLSEYDYNASYMPSLQCQQPREPLQHYPPQQQVHQTIDYATNRHDIHRDPLSLQGHMTNNMTFGDPQGSSTPDIYQRKPICFSPDDFPSPYHYDVPSSNHQWLGGSNYSNSAQQQNLRQPDYFLNENPIVGSSYAPLNHQKSINRGKAIIDIPAGGDYRPGPQIHDNTTMTFTPRSLMESHLSNSYVTGISQHLTGPKQSYPPYGMPAQVNPSLRNMDCSSIYPSRDFIEKASGSCYKRPGTPAKIPSMENFASLSKKPKLRSLSETDVSSEKNFDGYHLGYPPEVRCGPPRHKYYVVNPSDATTMAPKTLIAKYIDFLILENEQITEISKSVSHPVDIYVTEDMYFMDSLKNRVPFPSKKFMEWVRSFYPKLKLQNMKFYGMPGKYEDLPRGEDRRQTQQVLEDIFYYFQRQVMNQEDES